MDRTDALRRFDREVREDPPPAPGVVYERDGSLVREVTHETNIIFHRLSEAEAAGRLRAEMHRATARGHGIEWKVYGHDVPPSLPGHLRAAGFAPDPAETLVVRDLTASPPRPPSAAAFRLELVTPSAGASEALRVRRLAFGPEDDAPETQFRQLLENPDSRTYLLYRDGVPVSTGRVDLPPGRTFAGLWGGGTVPSERHRGAYRALVEARADVAARAGFRYVFVEARETSRPTLERMGFERWDEVQGWRWTPRSA